MKLLLTVSLALLILAVSALPALPDTISLPTSGTMKFYAAKFDSDSTTKDTSWHWTGTLTFHGDTITYSDLWDPTDHVYIGRSLIVTKVLVRNKAGVAFEGDASPDDTDEWFRFTGIMLSRTLIHFTIGGERTTLLGTIPQ